MATGTDNRELRPVWAEVESYPATLTSHAHELWMAAILTYLVGDLVTTFVGLRYTPLIEAGPLPAALLAEFGFGALVVLKAALVGLFLLLWRVVPRPASVGVPLGLLIVGSAITAWNTLLITFVLI